MGSLDRRLKLLEGGGGKPCPECGRGSQRGLPASPAGNVKIKVRWWDLDHGEEEDGERPEYCPEYCPECGRQLVYVVRWLDLKEFDPEDSE